MSDRTTTEHLDLDALKAALGRAEGETSEAIAAEEAAAGALERAGDRAREALARERELSREFSAAQHQGRPAGSPPARARLTDRHWVVDRCPHCGGRHAHGRGPEGSDPADFLGHSAAHCDAPGSADGYVLVDGRE
jgi:hypothetical protein